MGTKTGTTFTELQVIPTDWLTNSLSVQEPWIIWYRYEGTLIRIKGMNREKDHRARIRLTKQLIKEEQDKLQKQGYNPITGSYTVPKPIQPVLQMPDSTMPVIEAFNLAFSKLEVDSDTLPSVKSCLKYVTLYIQQLHMDSLSIIEVRKAHIKMLMDHIREQRKLSNRSWNAYRSYLMMLFSVLNELEMVDHDPAQLLKKKKEPFTYRKTLTLKQREQVKQHLSTNHPVFYRFVQIFFHSGTRRNEIMGLQIKDIDLEEGNYLIWVNKGDQPVQYKKPIKNIALPYWEEQIRGYPGHYYVFGRGLVPGLQPIRPEQVTRRWKRHVKDKLGILPDLYSLKHLNTDETAEILNIHDAAGQNSHTSTIITKKRYASGEEQRLHNRIKGVNNNL